MALVTLEDYNGNKFDINPALVQSVASYMHFDHDMELPADLMITNADDHPEVSNDPEKLAAANELRTSERTIISFANGGSMVVKGTVDAVKKALGEGPAKSR